MNRFCLSTKKSLGDVTCVRIFHDNSGVGKMASWYCEKIVVYDMQTKMRWYNIWVLELMFLFCCVLWRFLCGEHSKLTLALLWSVMDDKTKKNAYIIVFEWLKWHYPVLCATGFKHGWFCNLRERKLSLCLYRKVFLSSFL